jgi:RNA-directed DNA polymerase
LRRVRQSSPVSCKGWSPFFGFTHSRGGRFILNHKTQCKRLTRKLKALRRDAWPLMHAPLAEQHHWYSSALRGHYGYFGMPHNWRSLNGLRQEGGRIWFNCLKRRSQKNRRVGWDWFDGLTARLRLPTCRITHPWTPQAARCG